MVHIHKIDQYPPLYNPEWETTNRGHIFNDHVNNLIGIATDLISNTKRSSTSSSSSSSSSFRGAAPFAVNYTDNSWNCGSKNSNYVNPNDRRGDRREKKEDKSGLYLVIGAIGVALAAVFAYKAGKSAPEQMEASDTVTDLEAISDSIAGEHETSHKVKVVSLIDNTTKLAKAKQKSANWDLALKVALFVSGVALFSGASMAYVGGIAAIQTGQSLMTAGLVSAFVATCGLLFKSGFESHQNRKIEGAIRKDIADIKEITKPFEWERVENSDGTVTWQLVKQTPPPPPNYPDINPAVAEAVEHPAPSAPPAPPAYA